MEARVVQCEVNDYAKYLIKSILNSYLILSKTKSDHMLSLKENKSVTQNLLRHKLSTQQSAIIVMQCTIKQNS